MRGLRCSLALALGPLFVLGQTSVGTCGDLPTFIDEDVEAELTSATISCNNFTEIVVTAGATLTISSTQTETTLENLRIQVESDSVLVSLVPNLTWTSKRDTYVSGAALRVDVNATGTFSEDVTFSEGLSYDRSLETGGVVSNSGTLIFSRTATFIDTVDGGAIFNDFGDITFGGNASFINNKLTYDGDSYDATGAEGAGIHNLNGKVTFEAAAYFRGNEVVGERSVEFEGIYYFGGRGAGVYTTFCHDTVGPAIVFKGEATFVGNKARTGPAVFARGECDVRFESLATFTDNEATSESDTSYGGAVVIIDFSTMEFQGGLTATGNAAKEGGAFYVGKYVKMTVTGPVIITGNEARYSGGAIYNGGTVVLPADANISDNVAVLCPGILNSDNDVYNPFDRYPDPQAQIEFTRGASFTGRSADLCYLGVPTIEDSSPVPEVLKDRDCDSLLSKAPILGFYHYVVLDSRETSSVDLDATGDAVFACSETLIVFVTGGGELSITSSANSFTLSKVRLEVLGYTKLVLDLPSITITGFERSEFGGTMYIERDSSLDVMDDIIFTGNTFRYLTDDALNERGGAAIYSAGDVKFFGKTFFLGNGLYEPGGAYSTAGPGGAVANIGYMEFMKKGTFNDNFILDGSNGGAIANGGTLVFNLGGIFRNNTVENGYNDDGEPRNGFGGGLFNYGDSATVLFKRLAIFQDNIGGFRSGAIAAVASEELENGAVAGNRITFEAAAKFRDNGCKTRYPNTGGAGLWVYGLATVDFQDRAVFKRNNATNGGAIMNTGNIFFASSDLVTMDGNIASESCPDIKNYDKDMFDHENGEAFGNISDSDSTWYEGTVYLSDEVFLGESAEICDFR